MSGRRKRARDGVVAGQATDRRRRPRSLAEHGAVLFDLDGVLLDSEPLRTQIARAMLATEGHEVPEGIGRTYLGRNARTAEVTAAVLEALG